jgi:hypothetical protein
VWRVVLEAAVLGRVVRRGDHDPVRRSAPAIPVVREDRVRDRRGRRETVACVDHHLDVVRAEHLEDRPERRLRERVGIPSEEKGAVDALGVAVAADRLRDRQHVRLIERAREGAPSMAGGPKGDALLGDGRIRRLVVVGVDQTVDVDQLRLVRQLSRPGADIG